MRARPFWLHIESFGSAGKVGSYSINIAEDDNIVDNCEINLKPPLSVQTPILNRFGDVLGLDLFATR